VTGKTLFYLKHLGSNQYLTTENGFMFNHNNCPRCPIIGQREVHCQPNKLKQALWKIHSGFFFPMAEDDVLEDLEDDFF
jgi:hypothetical protein